MTSMLIPMLLSAVAASQPVAMPVSVNGQPTRDYRESRGRFNSGFPGLSG